MKTIKSFNASLCVIGNVCAFSTTSKGAIASFAVMCETSENEVAYITLAKCIRYAFDKAQVTAKESAIDKELKAHGIFIPTDIKEQATRAIRRAEDNTIYICSNVTSALNEDNILVYSYSFEPLFVSDVPFSHTCLGMNKATREYCSGLKSMKEWRKFAARIDKAQFNAFNLGAMIRGGKTIQEIVAHINEYCDIIDAEYNDESAAV